MNSRNLGRRPKFRGFPACLPAGRNLVASFVPALMALLLIAPTAGRSGAAALAGKLAIWRVGWPWYAAALGIPIAISLAIRAVGTLLESVLPAQTGHALGLLPVIFVLAAGEELGWRGYALPQRLARLPPLPVARLLGALHAAYHLPFWIAPGFPAPAYSLASFVVTSLALGIVWTWLYQHTGGSVLIATLFHGAVNAAGNLFFGGIQTAALSWLMPAGYGGVAFIVLALNGPGLSRTQAVRLEERQP